MFDSDSKIKVTDFGFAYELQPGEKLKGLHFPLLPSLHSKFLIFYKNFHSDLVGTPGYLAPEVLKCSMYENSEGYGQEVDNWACGVIMYTL